MQNWYARGTSSKSFIAQECSNLRIPRYPPNGNFLYENLSLSKVTSLHFCCKKINTLLPAEIFFPWVRNINEQDDDDPINNRE